MLFRSLESKIDKSRFVRVDSDVVENLIPKADKRTVELTADEREMMTEIFKTSIPKVEKAEFIVTFETLSADANPVVLTQNEYMRRMKEMAALQPGMSFYGELPDSYNLIVNMESPVIKAIKEKADTDLSGRLFALLAEINTLNAQTEEIRKNAPEGKLTDDDNSKISEIEKKVAEKRDEEKKMTSEYAASQPAIGQVIDLALLGNGLLKGADLNEFIRRSVKML